MGFPRQEYWVGCHFLLQGFSWPRDQTHISCFSCIGRYTLYRLSHQESLLRLLLLSCFSVRLCETPQMAAHQAPTSLGFSRREHWSGLPFLSPMHESEKWKRSRSVVSDSSTPWTAAHRAPLSMGFSRQEYWSGVPLPSPPGKPRTRQTRN